MPQKISVQDNKLYVPNDPIIPVIEGDGVGPELWATVKPILEAAAQKTGRRVHFQAFPAGEVAYAKYNKHLPEETLQALKEHRVSIKGPLSTPVGGGIRSLNVFIRQALDLYACVRPISHIKGVPSPVKAPQKLNMVIFRENTEDVYAGLEWPSGSSDAEALAQFLRLQLNVPLAPSPALGIKPMTQKASKRLVRMAIEWAIKNKCPSVTLVHKGNIMKYTEGAFRTWGYEVAKTEFGLQTVPESEKEPSDERIVIKDRIADNMFMQTLLRPDEYSVIATPNLNGDYLSDALAAQIGGLGIAPGANIGDGIAVFEAIHGTAPKYTGKDFANPSSLLLSGALMLDYLGWEDAGVLIRKALSNVIGLGFMTGDLARQLPEATPVGTRAFGEKILKVL
ncbi:MAG: NADP-dependent isocitrate dehydrogenase [Deltaproteobacteria bacterium]|jgi:isocitrate dehydrogenase|nr:NADP-dependent isocitrate dehydrogenase [Deltaproteobacteria bacterium]